MIVFLIGTSSSGKTSIVKQFPKKYNKVFIDEIFNKSDIDFYKDVKNEYYGVKHPEVRNIWMYYARKKMIELANTPKNGLSVIDDIVFYENNLMKMTDKKIIRILIYTDPNHLIKNIISRMHTEPRGKWVFTNFTDLYEITDDEKSSIDTINRKKLILLLKKIKWDFRDEKQLKEFAYETCKDMGIDDDKDHFIKVKDNNIDYIIKTKGYDPKKLYKFIYKIVETHEKLIDIIA